MISCWMIDIFKNKNLLSSSIESIEQALFKTILNDYCFNEKKMGKKKCKEKEYRDPSKPVFLCKKCGRKAKKEKKLCKAKAL